MIKYLSNMTEEEIDKLRKDKETEIKTEIKENKKIKISEKGKLTNISSKELLDQLMDTSKIKWAKKDKKIRKI